MNKMMNKSDKRANFHVIEFMAPPNDSCMFLSEVASATTIK